MGFLKKLRGTAVLVVAGAICVAACSDATLRAPDGVSCLPGTSQGCICPGSGATGSATCDSTFGVMGPCVCEATTPDGLVTDSSDAKVVAGAPSHVVLGLSAGGRVVTSPTYRLQLQIGPAITSGQASSPSYRIQLGILR